MDKNKNLALYGIIGAVLYAIADLFLYVGVEIESGNLVSYCHVKEWRLMASMWISVFGSLGLLCGFISLYQLVKRSFGEKLKFIMILPLLACGGILYCHFVLGVYNPLTMAIVLCGYITELIVIAGVLSGKFGLKKRFLLFMYLGYAIFYAFVILLVKTTGITGLRGGLESLFETTFFLPAFFAWKKEQ